MAKKSKLMAALAITDVNDLEFVAQKQGKTMSAGEHEATCIKVELVVPEAEGSGYEDRPKQICETWENEEGEIIRSYHNLTGFARHTVEDTKHILDLVADDDEALKALGTSKKAYEAMDDEDRIDVVFRPAAVDPEDPAKGYYAVNKLNNCRLQNLERTQATLNIIGGIACELGFADDGDKVTVSEYMKQIKDQEARITVESKGTRKNGKAQLRVTKYSAI